MPDEDQNIGTTENNPAVETPSPSTPDSTTTQSEANISDSDTPAIESTPLNTVGAALDAFHKNKDDQQGNYPVAKPVVASVVARDYSGLDPEEVPLFKKMSNIAFDALKPKFLEYKKLKEDHGKLKNDYESASKSSFYENENAYEILPEYKHVVNNSRMIDGEIAHWQEQLVAIREGKPWIPLFRDANGNVVQGEPREATPAAEAQIFNAMIQGQRIKGDLDNKIEKLKSEFTNQHKTFTTKLQEVTDGLFKGADNKALEQAMLKELPAFPAYLHNRPEIRALAKSMAVIKGLTILLQQKDLAATTNNLKARTAANAGPKNDTIAASVGKGSTVGAVWDEFNKARMAGVL